MYLHVAKKIKKNFSQKQKREKKKKKKKFNFYLGERGEFWALGGGGGGGGGWTPPPSRSAHVSI